MPNVAVLIPGILGSELRLGSDLIWPGPLASLVFAYRKMDQLLSPDLVATDVIRSYSFSTQYQALIDDLGQLGFTEGDRTLLVFPYDWRKANEQAAERLAALLDGTPGDAEVTLVAHSMGGLIARYYLESGAYAGRPGFARVRRLITLGTPHRGAPLALTRLLGQEKLLWLSAAQVRQAANDPRYPAVYQLLPPPAEPFAWNEDPDAELAGLDPYGGAAGQALGLVPENVEAARAFHARLDVSRRPGHVRYFCFSGVRQTTAAFATFVTAGAGFQVRKVERDNAGDGTVPYWSSTLPGIQSMPVGGEHSTLYKDWELRRTLAALLGQPEAFGPLPFEVAGVALVDVAVRDRVTEPGKMIRVVLSPQGGAGRIDGSVQVEKADDLSKADPAFVPAGPPLKVEYQGPLAESLGLLLAAPGQPGGYRLAYYHQGARVPTGSDAFFVQEPAPAGTV